MWRLTPLTACLTDRCVISPHSTIIWVSRYRVSMIMTQWLYLGKVSQWHGPQLVPTKSQWSKSNCMKVIGDSSQVKSNWLVCAGGKSQIVNCLPQQQVKSKAEWLDKWTFSRRVGAPWKSGRNLKHLANVFDPTCVHKYYSYHSININKTWESIKL